LKLRFTPRATTDLIEIAEYIRAESPRGAQRVRSAILASVQLLADHPLIGRRQSVEGVRKLVTPRFGYLIYYSIEAEEIAILSVQHPARDRLFSDE
jgi:toxin ParE1/3/4